MGITNQFYAVSDEELSALTNDLDLFQEKVNPANDDEKKLDMDKAGMELLMVLGPDIVEMGEATETTMKFHNIALLFGGGTPIHPEFDMGFGPSISVTNDIVQKATSELANLDFETLMNLVNEAPAVDFGMVPTDEEDWKGYHWPHLQNLKTFCEENSSNGENFIRVFC